MSEQADTTQTTDQTDAPQGMDALMSRMDELSQSVQSLMPKTEEPSYGGLSDAINPYQQDYGQQGVEEGAQWDQQGYEPGQYDQLTQQDPDQALAEANRIIDERVQQGIEKAITPWMQQQQQREHIQQARELEQKYPDLQKGEVVGPVMQAVERRAMAMQRPDLIRNPEFIELVYLAQQAQTNASQQTAADGGSEAHIEGEGAVPAEPEDDFAQRVVNAGNGGNQGGFRWF